MPTYQYVCTACDERSEVVQKFSDDPLTECRICGGRLRKVFSPVGIVFKGSGFYRTDSRSSAEASKNAAKPNASDGDSTSSSSSTPSGDSKKESGSSSTSASSGETGGTTSDGKKTSDSKKTSSPSKEKVA